MHVVRGMVVALSLAGISACHMSPVASVPAQPPGKDVAAPTDARPASPFTIGIGDEVSLTVWRHSDLNGTFRVTPDGTLSIPLAGRIPAYGRTLDQIAKSITDGMTPYVVDPKISVSLATIRSRMVHVLGEVKTPGNMMLDRDTSVWHAIATSGGFTPDANTRYVLVLRPTPDRVLVSPVNLDVAAAVRKGTPLEKSFLLADGDIVYVPPLVIANVERFMVRLQNIIAPFLSTERSIVLGPEVVDALTGNTGDSDVTLVQ